VKRVLVAGISGAGKPTLARAVARRRNLPFTEIDALHHGPGWTPLPTFRAALIELAARDRWIADAAGYPDVIEILWPRADTVVWLDLGRARVMTRVIERSFARAVTGEELWNGNRERFRDWLDSEHPIRWAWRQHGPRRAELAQRLSLPGAPRAVRLRTRREVDRWLASLPPTGAER